MSTLYTASGQRLLLGKEIGRGGEGAVYEVQGSPGQVAKLYHKPAPPIKAKKLRLMARAGTDRLQQVTAWPLTTLSDRSGGPVRGLVMRRIQGHRAVHLLYNPRSRLEKFKRADFRFLVHAAMNVARAFVVVHQHGHVIGDVNHSGILISEGATATLIDCDSFQVHINGDVFRCEVGVPEYTPPELQGKNLGTEYRTVNHDAFGLAVLIFHLLFAGRHPFAGVFAGRGQPTLGRSIQEGRFAYGPGALTRGMRPPPYTPPLEFISEPIAELFERAFVSKARPKAEEWVQAIESLAGELRACTVEKSHVYWSKLGSCPWCPIEAATGGSIFPITTSFAVPRTGTKAFDISRVWGEIDAIAPPLRITPPASNVLASRNAERLRALRSQKVKRARARSLFMQAFTVAVGGGLVLLVSPILFLGLESLWSLVTLVVGWWMIDEGRSTIFNEEAVKVPEIRKLQTHVEELRKQKAAIELALDRDVYGPFRRKRSELEDTKRRLAQVEMDRRQAHTQLRKQAEHQQRALYLRSVPVSRCNASGVGPARRKALQAHGITTAADVERRRVSSVPGFGPHLVSQVLSWRREVEQRFRYKPAQGPSPADLAKIDRRFNAERQRIEAVLVQGPRELTRIKNQTEPTRAAKASELSDLLGKLAQVETDLRYALG